MATRRFSHAGENPSLATSYLYDLRHVLAPPCFLCKIKKTMAPASGPSASRALLPIMGFL